MFRLEVKGNDFKYIYYVSRGVLDWIYRADTFSSYLNRCMLVFKYKCKIKHDCTIEVIG